MSDQTKTEDFTKSLRSSATLLLRTLDRLQYDYSEASAGELSERISFLAELDRLENREAPIRWHICASGCGSCKPSKNSTIGAFAT
jgi:hypothetical protein